MPEYKCFANACGKTFTDDDLKNQEKETAHWDHYVTCPYCGAGNEKTWAQNRAISGKSHI